ncbi:MAG: DUF4397 domain-containing protein [Ignavibacteria bacterium]|nr:DUF4397 domain-containing protein [Ignavibacteria bacterium]
MKKNLQFKGIRRLLLLSFAILSLSILHGCSEDDSSPTGPTAQTAFLSFVNASPDSPNIDLYIGNALVQANIPYLGKLPYLTFNAGNNQIVVRISGTTDTLININSVLQNSTFYSLFVIDSLADIQPVLFTDNLTAPGVGNCKVRFMNLSPNSQILSLQAEGTSLPWFPFYEFPPDPASADYNFSAIAPGLYNLDLLVAGTSNVLYTLPNIALTQGTIYTIFANGFQGGSGTQSLGLTIIENN